MKMAKAPTVATSGRGLKKSTNSFVTASLLFSAGILVLLLMMTIWKLAASGLEIDMQSWEQKHTRAVQISDFVRGENVRGVAMPHDVALALLHFATTQQVPQQSKEEIATTLGVLFQRAPCNFLVFGMWHDSLLWATFNYGGRTVFIDESQEWIHRMRVKHPELEAYKVDYRTSLQDAPHLLMKSRETRSTKCRPNQLLETSECALALSQLPKDLLSVQWDAIMIDGPRSYPKLPSFPGRMSPIFTSAVMAHTRTASGFTDIFLHDVSRPMEKQFGEEFLCRSNLVKRVGDLWHFQVHPSNGTEFCSELRDTDVVT